MSVKLLLFIYVITYSTGTYFLSKYYNIIIYYVPAISTDAVAPYPITRDNLCYNFKIDTYYTESPKWVNRHIQKYL